MFKIIFIYRYSFSYMIERLATMINIAAEFNYLYSRKRRKEEEEGEKEEGRQVGDRERKRKLFQG